MNNDSDLSKVVYRRYQLIHALATRERPTKAELLALTGTSDMTFRRYLNTLRAEFDIDISLVRPTGRSDDQGAAYYQMRDTGILDIQRFLAWWEKKQ